MDRDRIPDGGRPKLPEVLPVFPLAGVLLLPDGVLPLNIFEPRYLALTEDALGAGRLMGMIQPVDGSDDRAAPELYPTGCAGRIIRFSETPDGRYLITLAGTMRFDIERELEPVRGYRRVVPDWSPWRCDLEPAADPGIDRARLMAAVQAYFGMRGIEPDWDALRKAGDARLAAAIAMNCPFAPHEKQALLSARTPGERAELTIALLEMALHENEGRSSDARH